MSTGGGDKRGDNLAVASAQGKHVISSASSDALTAADADNDMEGVSIYIVFNMDVLRNIFS